MAKYQHGLARRKRKDGTVVWQARPVVAGKRGKAKTFLSYKEAKAWKAAEEAKAHDIQHEFVDETCDHFALRWPDDYPVVKSGPTRGTRKQENTLDTYRSDLHPFVAEFRGVPLGKVSRSDARRFALKHPRSATVARNVFADAIDDELVETNPFRDLRLEQSPGRKNNTVMPLDSLHKLADTAVEIWPEYGQVMRAMILFSAFVGPREFEMYALDRSDVDFAAGEVSFRVAKFRKQRTVMLLDEAAEALRSMPARTDVPYLFWSRRGQRLTKTNHYYLWNRVRDRAGMSDLEWHELRHWCGHHFYVTLGYSDELAGFQLGHAGGREIRERYGHGQQDALKRLKQGRNRPAVVTSLPHVTEESA